MKVRLMYRNFKDAYSRVISFSEFPKTSSRNCASASLLILVLFLAGCGDNLYKDYPYYADINGVSISKISLSPAVARVGVPSDLSVSVIGSDGVEYSGITENYVDPEFGMMGQIKWESLDKDIAVISNPSKVVGIHSGYVTLKATIGGVSKSINIYIKERLRGESEEQLVYEEDDDVVHEDDSEIDPENIKEDEDDSEIDHGDDEEEVEERVGCQGHAVRVLSFEPGEGAGFGEEEFPDIVLGPPEGRGDVMGSTNVLSLGRGGEIVLDLERCEVVDGPGVDFIIFENPFFVGGDSETPFYELAEVGVSRDGESFVEFDCNRGGYPFTGCAGWNPVYSSTSNHVSPFDTEEAGGDPFDLSDISVESARYIRIRDINTIYHNMAASPSAGFDLDAVSVINGIHSR